MKIVFLDPKCPTPYDSATLALRGLGGSEATVIRIARALAAEHDVSVVQHNRVEPRQEGARLAFLPLGELARVAAAAQHVFFVHKAQHIDAVARVSKARLWLWLHNYLADEVPLFWLDHLRFRLGIVCVSRTHAEHTRRQLRRLPQYWASGGLLGRGGVLWHHNPLDDALAPDPAVVRDPHKLVFFSSPHKGIEQVLRLFGLARQRDPWLKLFVANPGYVVKVDPTLLNAPGIVKLGSLPQAEVLRHVREALCVFYPQSRRAETFGLVYAESNAVGTPVLAHRFGAAEEILSSANPPLDARDDEAVLATLARWIAHGGPAVRARPEFALGHVAERWNAFLAAPDAFAREQRTAAEQTVSA